MAVFDHLMHGGPELGALVDDMEARTGVRAAYGGRHQGAQTHNALLSLGKGKYLELIAPVPDADPESPLVALLAGLDRPRNIVWAARVVNIDAAVRAAAADGYNAGSVMEMARSLPGESRLTWKLTVGGDDVVMGVIPFLIQWESGTHPSETAPAGCTLLKLRAEHPDPKRVRSAASAIGVDLDVAKGAAAAVIARLKTRRGEIDLG